MIAGPAGGECEIREVGVGDAVALARLLGELKSNPHSPEQIATQLVASPEHDRVLVAEAATEVVGFASVRIGPCLWGGAPKAELVELYVQPAWRRRGVGRALVGRGQALAWAAGATTLGVSIGLRNDGAQDFYRAIGFEQRRLTLDLLAPGQSEAVVQSATRRVLVVGGPGSGKTTLARRIGDLLGVPVLDLDLVAFELGLDSGESLRARLYRADELAAEESWVAEGVCTVWTKALIQRGDLVVWLDLPWPIAAWRIVLRHVRAELAGNNRYSGWMKLVRFVWWGVRYYYLWRDPFATPGGPPGGEEFSWAATLRDLLPARDRLVVCRRSVEVSALLRRLADGRPAASLASDEPARPDSNQRRGGVSGDGAGAAADS